MANSVSDVNELRITYDIACQWSRNLIHRTEGFGDQVFSRLVQPGLHVRFGIPKFHLPAHGDKCQSTFSLNLVDGWARVDGEAIERVWSVMNMFATSIREMALGTRQDFVDDKIGNINFRKVVGMGE